MNGLAVIVVAYDEAECAIQTIESIRRFNDIDDLSLYLVDNASTDGLSDWVADQHDITYIYMDEGYTSIGILLNSVIRELDINTDFVVLRANLLITPHYFGGLMDGLRMDLKCGALGGMSNEYTIKQRFPQEIDNYYDIINLALDYEEPLIKKAIGINGNALIIKMEMFRDIGGFDEKISGWDNVFGEFFLRMIEHGWYCGVNETSYVWNMKPVDEYEKFVWSDEARNYDKERIKKLIGSDYSFGFEYRNDIIRMILDDDVERERNYRILEVGCNFGASLVELKNLFPNAEIFGVEINEDAARVASAFCDCKACNVEEQELDFQERYFDYIIFSDVLEHLRNPLATMKYISRFLGDNGKIIACIPNLMNFSVMKQLLNGWFTYEDWGLLDRTHVHMFTMREIVNMFVEAGYDIEDMRSKQSRYTEDDERLINELLKLGDATKEMYITFQYLLRAKVKR